MKKALQYGLFAVAVAAIALLAACSGDSATSTPVAPASADLTAMTEEARSNDYVKICHYNPDYAYDGGYQWTVVEVDWSAMRKHCAKHEWDTTVAGGYGCTACASLAPIPVGGNCSVCD